MRVRDRSRVIRTVVVAAACALALSAALLGSTSRPVAAQAPSSAASCHHPLAGLPASGATQGQGVPYLCHVFVIMFENHSYADLTYESDLPYIHQLARTYGLATQYYGVTHPTVPNRVGFWSGRGRTLTDSVKNNSLSYPNLIDQMSAHGISWGAYYQHSESSTNAHPVYNYLHNSTLMLFKDIARSPARLAHLHPLPDLTPALRSGRLPQFTYIGPNFVTNMHGTFTPGATQFNFQGAGLGGAVGGAGQHDAYLETRGDNFLHTWIPQILHSPAWHQGPAAIFFCFDENNYDASMPQNYYYVSNSGVAGSQIVPAGTHVSGPTGFNFPGGVLGGGRSLAIVITNTARHVVSKQQYNEYSILRTIEQSWHLGYLGHAASPGVISMGAFFHGGGAPTPAPNPLRPTVVGGGYPVALNGTPVTRAAPVTTVTGPSAVLRPDSNPHLTDFTDHQAGATLKINELSPGALHGDLTLKILSPASGVSFSAQSNPAATTFVPSADDSGVMFAPSTVTPTTVTIPVASPSSKVTSTAYITGLMVDVASGVPAGAVRVQVSSGATVEGTVTVGTVGRPQAGPRPVLLAPVVHAGSVAFPFVAPASAPRGAHYEIEVTGSAPTSRAITVGTNQFFLGITTVAGPVLADSMAQLTNLAGKEYWVRVREMGSSNGAWSGPRTFTVRVPGSLP